jgi:hypothetical protein
MGPTRADADAPLPMIGGARGPRDRPMAQALPLALTPRSATSPGRRHEGR